MIYLNKKNGFTLIDLLISVAIISLLSSITVYNTTEARKKAEDAHMAIESDQVKKAITLYKDDNDGRAPFSGSFGVFHEEGNPDGETDDYEQAMQKLVDGGYLPEIPRSPSGISYSYMVTSDEKNAIFVAKLHNKTKSSSSNSCTTVPVFSGPLYENCIEEARTTSGDDFCSTNFLLLYDPEYYLCVDGPSTNFCSVYNQDNDYDYYCNCTGPSCDAYGGETYNDSGSSEATVCDISSNIQEDSISCNGTSNTDLCQCI